MGNVLESASVSSDGAGSTKWALALDCRPEALRPLLVCHEHQLILQPHQIHELVQIASAPDLAMSFGAHGHDICGDLPPSMLANAASLRASQLLTRETLDVPPNHDSVGIESVPVSSAMLMYQSTFGRVLIEFMCRSRRVQLDLVAERARRSLLSHPTSASCENLRKIMVLKGMDSIPGERGTQTGAHCFIKRIRSISNRESKHNYLVSKAIVNEFELMPYGQLSSLFVIATSPSLSGKTPEEEAAASYLQTFWKHTKALTTYPGLLRLQREGQLGTALRLLLALSASTASFEVSIHTITALLLVSCTSKLSDMQLDWQALCTLNRLRIKERSETASPEGNGVSVTETCLSLLSVMQQISPDNDELSSHTIDAAAVSIDPSSTIALLELVRRVIASYFARVHHEDTPASDLRGDRHVQIRAALVAMHNVGTLQERISTVRTLNKVLNLISKDPENSTFRRINTSSPSLRSALVTPEGCRLFEVLGFRAIEKRDGSEEVWEAEMMSSEDLEIMRDEVDCFIRQCWSALLPSLLQVLHFHLRLRAQHFAYLSSRDACEVFADKFERLGEVFNDLISVVSIGFGMFEENEERFRVTCSRLAIRIVCDGIHAFLPKASQQVSFLSRLFDVTHPFTPSSSFRRDLTMPQPARKELTVYLFLNSLLSKNSSYLTSLAFGQAEDIWARLVFDIWKEAPEDIAWKRVCRVITDIQMNDAYFERYKNDPVMSPILNKIMRASDNDVAPLKMNLINEALIRQACSYPEMCSQHLSPIAVQTSSDSIELARNSAVLLFSFQRGLFNRSIVDRCRADQQSSHPTLEFSRLVLRMAVRAALGVIHTHESGSHVTLKHCDEFRRTLVGSLLPHILLGLSASSSLYHSENKALHDVFEHLQSLKEAFGDSEDLDDEMLQGLVFGGNDSEEYEYDKLESVLDGGNAVEDILLHNDFIVDSEKEDGGEAQRAIALRRLQLIMQQHNVRKALKKEVNNSSKLVIEDLARIQKSAGVLAEVLTTNGTLRKLVHQLVFGREGSSRVNSLRALELPSLCLCSLCGITFASERELLDHSLKIGAPAASSKAASLCTDSRAWFVFLRHMLVWTIAKIAGRLVAGDKISRASTVPKATRSGEVEGQSQEQEWMSSTLFQGGLEPWLAEYSKEPFIISSHESNFFSDLIDGVNEAAVLDSAILALPQFRLFVHRKSGGEHIACATRAVVAALIKHSGHTSNAVRLARELSYCGDERKNLMLSEVGRQLSQLWAHADTLKPHWVFLHQEGILNVCSKKGCQQTVVFNNDFYRCDNGHEFEECETRETLSYAEIGDVVLQKVRLLLEVQAASNLPWQPSFLRRTSTKLRHLLRHKSVQLDPFRQSITESNECLSVARKHWRMIRTAVFRLRPQLRLINTPAFYRTIHEAVLAFVKDTSVDFHVLRKALQSTIACAGLRATGFEAFSKLFNKVPRSVRSVVVIELVSAIRDWPPEPEQIAHHYLGSIQNAGTEMLSVVKNGFSVVAGFVASLLRDTIGSDGSSMQQQKLSRSQYLEVLMLLDFWKLGFNEDDFTLLRSIGLISILERCASFDGLLGSAGFRLFNALGLLSFSAVNQLNGRLPLTSSGPNPATAGGGGELDLLPISILDSMLSKLKKDWPPLSQTDHALQRRFSNHESVVFETLSVLLLSCYSSTGQHADRFLSFLRASPAWEGVLLHYLSCVLEPSSDKTPLSARITRRVASLCSIVFGVALPYRVASLYFHEAEGKGSADAPERFIGVVLSCIGRFSVGMNFESDVSFGFSGKRCCTHRKAALRFLRLLNTNDDWALLISRMISEHLAKLAQQVGRNGLNLSDRYLGSHQPSQLSLLLGAVGALRFLGNYSDAIERGSRVFLPSTTGNAVQRRRFQRLNDSKSFAGLATVLDIQKTQALIVLDSDPSLALTSVELVELEAVSERLDTSNLVLTREALQALFTLVSLVPSGSSDRRKSSVERKCEPETRSQSLMLAQLQSYGMQALLELLEADASCDLLGKCLGALATSSSFVHVLLGIARTPIPLHEASELRFLDAATQQLALYVHDASLHDDLQQSALAVRLQQDLGVHIEWCRKAAFLHSDRPDLAQLWLCERHPSDELASAEPRPQWDEKTLRLSALGFPPHVCVQALEACKFNENLAANWLMDHGKAKTKPATPLPNPFEEESEWGQEGVDFFQEMGDGDFARDLFWRVASNGSDGNFEPFSDQYNRLALQSSLLFSNTPVRSGRLRSQRLQDPAVPSDYASDLLQQDLRIGQLIRISPSWARETERIGNEATGSYRWFLNSVQNTWEPFDDNVTAQLEERWRLGDTFCAAILDSEPFMFRLDRMAMYHSMTGYMVRLRRRKSEKASKSPFHLVSNDEEKENEEKENAEIEELSDEDRLQKQLATLTPLQRDIVDQVHAVVSDFPKAWALQALSKNNFDPNIAVEWLFANSTMLADMDHERSENLERSRLERERKKLTQDSDEASRKGKVASGGSSAFDGDEDIALLTAFAGELGHIVEIDESRSRVKVRFCDLDDGVPRLVPVPMAALEWPDAWIQQHFPEICKRRPLGIEGLVVDAFIALGIVTARRAVLSILQRSLSSSPVVPSRELHEDTASLDEDQEELEEETNPAALVSLSRLHLKVGDVISILKLMANDAFAVNEFDAAGRSEVGIWAILRALAVHPKYSKEMVSFLLDDCLVHLRRSSTLVRECSSSHPYSDSSQKKEAVEIENARALIVEFDQRSHLKEGHAVLSIWSDADCSREISIFSGSGVCPQLDHSGSGFRPILIRGHKFWMTFGSGQMRASKTEFGYSFRVRPVGYHYEDEREMLKAPMGWGLLSLLTSSDTSPPVSLIDSCLRHRRAPELLKALMRYLRCTKSACKVFVADSITKLIFHLSSQEQSLKDSIFSAIGGEKAFLPLQNSRDRVREVNNRSPPGSLFSPFLKSLVDLLRISRQCFPKISFQNADVEVLHSKKLLNPWDLKVAIGRCTSIDVARVEFCLRALSKGTSMPSLQVYELAYEHLNNIQLLRLCLKELETSIKLNKQRIKWKDERRFWMTMVNTFKSLDHLGDILLMLRRSMLDNAFEPLWAIRYKDWEERLRVSNSLSGYALCLLELEDAFKWRDEKDDNRESALVTSWRSSRSNWIKTVRTLSDEEKLIKVSASIPTPAKADALLWSNRRNAEFVEYVDALIVQNARRLRSLTFVDIIEPRRSDMEKLYPSLKGVPLAHLRSRFGVLKMLNQMVAAIIIPVVNLWSMKDWSLGSLLRNCKNILFLEAKMAILTQSLQRMYSKEKDPQNVILNRHEAAKERANTRVRHSLFVQLYNQLRLVDAHVLRRKGQAWRVKFVGERGHDVGGLFSASLSDICKELMSDRLPLFVATPNGKHNIGENREKFVPDPLATSPQHLSWFEFVGKLMGIACLSLNRTLSIDLPSIVWKTIARETLSMEDLKAIDYPCWRMLHLMRNPELEKISEASFEYVFPELFFVSEGSEQSGREIELCAGGSSRRVTWNSRLEYAKLVEEYRLHELEVQIGAICNGMAQLVPIDFLALFSWQQLEVLVCGNPNIDINLLREKTIYAGSVCESDRHVQMFWEVIEEFSTEDRRAFLQFVWGRSRLPATRVGFGKDAFKISDHSAALQGSSHSLLNSNLQDQYFPVAHTCFFAIELPRYSQKNIMRQKILYAIHNCTTIDADSTQESMMNLNMSWSDGESDDESGDNDEDDRKTS